MPTGEVEDSGDEPVKLAARFTSPGAAIAAQKREELALERALAAAVHEMLLTLKAQALAHSLTSKSAEQAWSQAVDDAVEGFGIPLDSEEGIFLGARLRESDLGSEAYDDIRAVQQKSAQTYPAPSKEQLSVALDVALGIETARASLSLVPNPLVLPSVSLGGRKQPRERVTKSKLPGDAEPEQESARTSVRISRSSAQKPPAQKKPVQEPPVQEPVVPKQEAQKQALAAANLTETKRQRVKRAVERGYTGFAGYQTMMALAAAGVMNKRWVTRHDDKVRPTHAAAEGQTVPIAAAFIVGGEALKYPGDPTGSPGETYNCRCVTVAGASPASRAAQAASER